MPPEPLRDVVERHAPFGLGGSLLSLLIPSSALLVQELPRALVARALGRSSRISLAASGSETVVSPLALRGSGALARPSSRPAPATAVAFDARKLIVRARHHRHRAALEPSRVPVLLPLLVFIAAAALAALRTAFDESDDSQQGVLAVTADAEARLGEDDPRRARELAESALAAARSAPQKARLWRVLAWAAIGR